MQPRGTRSATWTRRPRSWMFRRRWPASRSERLSGLWFTQSWSMRIPRRQTMAGICTRSSRHTLTSNSSIGRSSSIGHPLVERTGRRLRHTPRTAWRTRSRCADSAYGTGCTSWTSSCRWPVATFARCRLRHLTPALLGDLAVLLRRHLPADDPGARVRREVGSARRWVGRSSSAISPAPSTWCCESTAAISSSTTRPTGWGRSPQPVKTRS